MKIYIAASWKNQHAVEMLTGYLRDSGNEVLSFIENNHLEGHGAEKPIPFHEWLETEQADQSFQYDTESIRKSDLVIYISPSGADAWAEVGLAHGLEKDIYGLCAKGEQIGLMRKMVDYWFDDYRTLLKAVKGLKEHFECL